jgi:type IV pilus secretin PilQ/predicted competence protein
MTKRRVGIVRRVLTSALVLLLLPIGTAAGAQTPPGIELRDVSVTTQPDSVTIVVKTTGEVKYQAELVDHPYRLVLDFDDTSYAWRKAPMAVQAEPLKQIRGSQYRRGVARVVLELTRKVGYAIREENDGLAIVIPTAPSARLTEPAAKPPVAVTAKPVPAAKPPAAKTPSAAVPSSAQASGEAKSPEPLRLAQAPSAPAPTAPAPTAPVPAVPTTPPPPPPAMPAPAAPVAANGSRLISLDFKDADVVNLLRILAAESTRNIVIGEDVKGKMSITLRNVPWDLALDTVLEAKGLVKVERDGVLRIVSQDQLARERESRAKLEEAKVKSETEIRTKLAEAKLKEQEAQARQLAAEQAAAEQVARGPLKEETIRLSYADPEEVAKTLEGILGLPSGGSAPAAPASGPGIIPAPPFSQLFGPGQPVPPPPTSPSVDVLAKGITIKAHKPTNSLFIRHYAADLDRIKTLIREKLDIPLPQVKIEARMEILARNDLFAIGVQWGGGGVATNSEGTLVGRGFTSNQTTLGGIAPSGVTNVNPNLTLSGLLPVSAATGLAQGGNLVNLPLSGIVQNATAGTAGIAFGIVGSRLNLNLALEALRSEGKTRTLARPEIVTVENSKASIALGEEIPYETVSSAGTQVQFKEAVLKLEVTPTVVREGDVNRIKMNILVENNSRGATVIASGGAAPPAINKRRAETQVLIREGERLVIGGVTNSESEEGVRKVPLFGDIPILGWLFKQRGDRNTSTELVVFITPSIVRRDAATASVPTTPR